MKREQIIQRESCRTRLQNLAPGVLRVTHIPNGASEFPPDRPWLGHVFPGLESASSVDGEVAGWMQATVEGQGLCILNKDGHHVLSEEAGCKFSNRKRFSLAWEMGKDEVFYGGGEWFNGFARRQGRLRMRNQESFSFLQGSRTYTTIPFFISSRKYALFLLNSGTSTWQFLPESNQVTVEAHGNAADYLVLYGKDYKEILQIYTSLSGRPPLLPIWALGLWVTSYPQDHQDAVMAHALQHRQRGIPLDVVILDYHWEERFHNFRWRQSLIPRPDELIKWLKDNHLHLGLITTPFVNHRNQPLKKIALQILAHDIPPGMVLSDECAEEEYQQARRCGFLAHANAEWWFGRGGMVDFTNPAACDWWNRMAARLYAQGVDFFKNDDGEYLPDDCASALGLEGEEYHNLYGFYYGRAMYEGAATLRQGQRAMIYARSVWAGSQRYPALFMGDQKPTFECIKRTMRAGLNMSMLGFSYWTADVFGLDGKTTPETHMRYAQWALFTPVARYFWRPPDVDDTRFPWSHNNQVEENFRQLAHLRYRLLPVYYTLAWQAYKTGVPMLRPMLLEFPDDAQFTDCYDQFLLGEALLFAPVVEPGAAARKVRLPQGAWYDFWSGKCWEGAQEIEVEAQTNHLPLFMRGGTILILGEEKDWISGQRHFERLTLYALPPYPAQGFLYEDDGVSMNYQQGAYRLTRFSVQASDGALWVNLEPVEDGMPEDVFERQVEIRLYKTAKIQGVEVENGKAELCTQDKSGFVCLKVTHRCNVSMQIKLIL